MTRYLFYIGFLIKSCVLFSQDRDSLLIPSLFLKKLEQDIPRQSLGILKEDTMPEFKSELVQLNVAFQEKELKYKVWSSEIYSLKSGWFVLAIIMNNKILFSKVLNENGRMACYMDTFSLKDLFSGIIKVIIYKKGGQNIAELKICYK
jgi:hypothetical protein